MDNLIKKIRNYILSDNNSIILIYICFVVATLPIILFRDFTPENELRYLCIADESIRNGNFFAFTNNGIPYADKPPLYLWLVICCRLISGAHSMWLLSLLSIVPAIVVVEIMNRMCRTTLSVRSSIGATAMLLSTAYFLGLSVTLRMDMLMTMFIVLALNLYIKQSSKAFIRLRVKVLFSVWVFLAVFTKGPIGILVPLLTTLCYTIYEKNFKTFRMMWGWLTWCILLCFCCLWFVCVYIDGGVDYLDNLLFHQTMGRAVKSFHHSRPFWWYAESIWYVAAPWSLVTIFTAIITLTKLKKESAIERFLLIECTVTFLLLSFISGKLQVYLLPLLPFLIYGFWCSSKLEQQIKTVRILAMFPVAACMLPFPVMLFDTSDLMLHIIFHNNCILAAGAVLFVGSLSSIVIWIRRADFCAFNKGVITFAITLFATVFCAGLSLKDLSPYLGFSKAAERTLIVAKKYNIPESYIYTYGIDRTENLSTLFNGKVPRKIERLSRKDISNQDSLANANKNIILNFQQELSQTVIVMSTNPLFHQLTGGETEEIGEVDIVVVTPLSSPKTLEKTKQ